MQISQEIDVFSYSIRGYNDGTITINIPVDPDEFMAKRLDPNVETPKIQQEDLLASFLISAKQLVRGWPPKSIEELTEDDVALMASMEPEVVILGTGRRLQWPPRSLFQSLIDKGIGYEVMDTAAACRTYNILSYEGRRIVAGLIID